MSELGRPFRLENDAVGCGLSCSSAGIALAGVPLLRATSAGLAPRPTDEISALIKGAYGGDVDPVGLVPGLNVIALALNRGEIGRAMIAALRLRLPDLNLAGATRIAEIEHALTKYNPDEPRDARGRWTTADESAPDNSEASVSTPPQLPSDTMKPILVSDSADNDNSPPITPNIVNFALTRRCISNALDPDYQSKVEQCMQMHQKCSWLIQVNKEYPQREDMCFWPDGSKAIMRFGVLIPISDGGPF